jgi:hypothetical protein
MGCPNKGSQKASIHITLIKYNSREGGAGLSKLRRDVNDGNVVSIA